MKVGMYYNNSDIRVEEMPIPEIGSDEILVKVLHAGICGSDVMEWYRIKKAPCVLGHEIAGIVEKVGDSVNDFKVGDRVFVSHHVPCNICHYCLKGDHTDCDTLHSTNFDPGGFAQYLRVPQLQVKTGTFKIPDDMPLEWGVFIEPLACVVRGIRKVGINPGDKVLILGSGISGALLINMAKVSGAGRIIATDIHQFRLDMAQEFGANFALMASDNLSEKVKEINDGRLADVVIISTGAIKAHEQALECVDRGGKILIFGVTSPETRWSLPVFDFYYKGVTMTSSYAGAPIDISQAIELIRNKRVDVESMITHRLPLEEINKGFELVAKAENSLKVIIEPHRT